MTEKQTIFDYANKNDIEGVKKCIDNGIDINLQDKDGWTPLSNLEEVMLNNGKIVKIFPNTKISYINPRFGFHPEAFPEYLAIAICGMEKFFVRIDSHGKCEKVKNYSTFRMQSFTEEELLQVKAFEAFDGLYWLFPRLLDENDHDDPDCAVMYIYQPLYDSWYCVRDV